LKLNLVPENSESLRKPSLPWEFEKDGSPVELITAMTDLMKLSGGIGLAAPQCGIQKRIFLLMDGDNVVVCINPTILSSSSTLSKFKEGCLSFPGLWLDIERPESITGSFQNAMAETVEREFTGLSARIFQHELDHLDGKCFDTLVSRLKLSLARKKQTKLSKFSN
jgi:peptide deformylase